MNFKKPRISTRTKIISRCYINQEISRTIWKLLIPTERHFIDPEKNCGHLDDWVRTFIIHYVHAHLTQALHRKQNPHAGPRTQHQVPVLWSTRDHSPDIPRCRSCVRPWWRHQGGNNTGRMTSHIYNKVNIFLLGPNNRRPNLMVEDEKFSKRGLYWRWFV